jgi:hypothetical protein
LVSHTQLNYPICGPTITDHYGVIPYNGGVFLGKKYRAMGMLKFHKLGKLKWLVNFQEKKIEIFSQFLSSYAAGSNP